MALNTYIIFCLGLANAFEWYSKHFRPCKLLLVTTRQRCVQTSFRLGRRMDIQCYKIRCVHSIIYSIFLLRIQNMKSCYVTYLLIHCKPVPVMKTGFSCVVFLYREKPVFITGFSLKSKTTQGKPCFHYRDGFAVYICVW